MPHATAPFTVDSMDDEELVEQDPGVRYARARIAKTFSGDLDGRSTLEMLSVRAESGGAGYVALERIEGRLHGRAGSFALLHAATMTADDEPWGRFVVVPGSGAGELSGLSGEGRIEVAGDGAHTFFLDYELS